jgi:hypothetical protein
MKQKKISFEGGEKNTKKTCTQNILSNDNILSVFNDQNVRKQVIYLSKSACLSFLQCLFLV